jgi:uncharacterized protein YjiS (DUF1127 family)
MNAHSPILPVTGGGFAALMAFVTTLSRRIVRALRNRRDAAMLAGLDRRMLADLGLTRSDVRDAFSEPFWEDPTALLRERAIERRWNRALMRNEIATRRDDFRRPRTDRPARHTV